ncbi:hypothetical protein O7626_14415 [Micromonospora sp. WMMD1102]|uniref:hypothetical protein n=1 Tax=Micromonospora sp. WMMD1102 TaxID=3016105 RepID=UPI0024154181|nr:hypothetical protein [Micromonospora sp. WMMD1102]MDG4787108.1 hypothetical protein [Micromonospora sp. WMMD1102]
MYERGHRYRWLRDGLAPSASMPAPASVDLLDVRTTLDASVTRAADQAVRSVSGRGWPAPAGGLAVRVVTGLGVLAGVARSVPGALPGAVVAGLVDDLAPVLGAVELAAGLTPVWVPVSVVECPVCALRSLRVRQESTEAREWVAECASRECVCRGVGCPCGVLARVRGRRHVWARDEWSTLATLTA